MTKKFRELFTNLLQVRSTVLSRKSSYVIQSFTDMIDRLNSINKEIDEKIAEANEVKAKIKTTTTELEKTKSQNEAIKSKIESIIS